METIPEDGEARAGGATAATTSKLVENRSVKREVYSSEQVDTCIRRVPESEAANWQLEEKLFHGTPAGGYYITEQLGAPDATSSAYSFSYESCVDPADPPPPAHPSSSSVVPVPEQPLRSPTTTMNGEYDADTGQYADFTHTDEDAAAAFERRSTQTQKITRVTKVTTTRSVRQIPEPAEAGATAEDYSFDASGALIATNGYISAASSSHHPPAHGGSLNGPDGVYGPDGRTAVVVPYDNGFPPRGGAADYQNFVSEYAVPSAPGAPQVVDVDASEVTLVWLRPDSVGDVADDDLQGYQIQYRVGADDPEWHPAHTGLVTDTTCTISNLQPNTEHQFRVVARNSTGFGEPSTPSPLVHLRPRGEPGPGAPLGGSRPPVVPYAPTRPQLVSVGGSTAALAWNAPLGAAPVAGYAVEFRPLGTDNWLIANDYLTPDCRLEVTGLRPNGEYEFRVLAKNDEGYSEPSQSTGPVRIRPNVPQRTSANGYPVDPYNEVMPPSQPQATDVDSDWVTLMWAPPPRGHAAVLGYIVESREIGDTNWFSTSDRLITSTQLTVKGLHPNSTYEFRVFAKTPDEGRSDASEVSELVQLRPKAHGPPRGVPARPAPPEIMERVGDQVTLCWMPAHSSLPVQGYDVEFKDQAQDPSWFKVNDLLMQSCTMTIGDLIMSHEYQFRVIAKNAMGYSEPSDPSEPILIGADSMAPPLTDVELLRNANQQLEREPSVPLTDGVSHQQQLQDELTRESPPLPDRDDSPPPIHRPPFSANMPHQDGVQWRDPTLHEVLDYLRSHDKVIQLNASGYLQHLTYHDNENKRKTKELGGIPLLIGLLNSDVPEIQKNACGCLKNLAYGRENDENKLAIRDAGGLTALTNLLTKTPDMQVKEEVTGALWNLSSSDLLKRPILEMCAETLAKDVVVPGSGWTPEGGQGGHSSRFAYNPDVFKNASGVIRNVSASTESARKILREVPHFIEALVHNLTAATRRKEKDSRATENVVCVLRNLSYRCQEVDDANYDAAQHAMSTLTLNGGGTSGARERSRSAPSGSPKVTKKKDATSSSKLSVLKKKKAPKGGGDVSAGGSPEHAVGGLAVLWAPATMAVYVDLLCGLSNPTTLEAVAGIVQNLAACYWQPAVDLRREFRKAKGLPPLVELLSLGDDRVVCAVTTALRNLALDQQNRELIGKYAMKDLVQKLPAPSQPRDRTVSDGTLTAMLGVLYETMSHSAVFTKDFDERGGTQRLVFLARSAPAYSPRVVKYAAQVLLVMWQHKSLHEMFRRKGYREQDFVPARPAGAGAAPPGSTTLARPISTQGAERPAHSRVRPDIDDDGQQQTMYGSTGSTSNIPAGPSRNPRTPDQHQMTPVNGNRSSSHYYEPPSSYQTTTAGGEPLYAQVQKGRSAPPRHNGARTPGGDSWV